MSLLWFAVGFVAGILYLHARQRIDRASLFREHVRQQETQARRLAAEEAMRCKRCGQHHGPECVLTERELRWVSELRRGASR